LLSDKKQVEWLYVLGLMNGELDEDGDAEGSEETIKPNIVFKIDPKLKSYLKQKGYNSDTYLSDKIIPYFTNIANENGNCLILYEKRYDDPKTIEIEFVPNLNGDQTLDRWMKRVNVLISEIANMYN